MSFKLNLGAGYLWRKPGWTVVDHNVKNKGAAWSIPLPDNSCSIVFSSHMIEHISHYRIEKVLCEINRVLQIGGTLRIVTPDLYKIARAYVEADEDFFEKALQEDISIRTDLGRGGKFMNFVVSPGLDSYLFDKKINEIIGGYGHLYLYDFEMLEILLEKHGFTNIVRLDFCNSAVPEMGEPLHIEGTDPEWHEFPSESEKKHGSVKVMTGFDRDPVVSLFVEATKASNIDYANYQDVNNKDARNFNSYGLPRGYINKAKSIGFAFISNTIDFLAYSLIKLRSFFEVVRYWKKEVKRLNFQGIRKQDSTHSYLSP